MRSSIVESGIITSEGRLRLPTDRLQMFCQGHKSKRVIVRVMVVEHGTSEAMLGYYFNYIVPTMRRAMYDKGELKTEKGAERWMREQCPLCYEGDELLETRSMSQETLADYLDWLKQWAAENYEVYIEDPRAI